MCQSGDDANVTLWAASWLYQVGSRALTHSGRQALQNSEIVCRARSYRVKRIPFAADVLQSASTWLNVVGIVSPNFESSAVL